MKLALVAPTALSLTASSSVSTSSTNSARLAVKDSNPNTNTLTLSFKTPAVQTNAPINLVLSPADDLQSAIRVAVVIKKNAEPGFFSDQGGNGSFGLAGIQAGYGQAYDSDSIVLRGRNGTAMEETRYLFFKKVIKF